MHSLLQVCLAMCSVVLFIVWFNQLISSKILSSIKFFKKMKRIFNWTLQNFKTYNKSTSKVYFKPMLFLWENVTKGSLHSLLQVCLAMCSVVLFIVWFNHLISSKILSSIKFFKKWKEFFNWTLQNFKTYNKSPSKVYFKPGLLLWENVTKGSLHSLLQVCLAMCSVVLFIVWFNHLISSKILSSIKFFKKWKEFFNWTLQNFKTYNKSTSKVYFKPMLFLWENVTKGSLHSLLQVCLAMCSVVLFIVWFNHLISSKILSSIKFFKKWKEFFNWTLQNFKTYNKSTSKVYFKPMLLLWENVTKGSLHSLLQVCLAMCSVVLFIVWFNHLISSKILSSIKFFKKWKEFFNWTLQNFKTYNKSTSKVYFQARASPLRDCNKGFIT